MISFLRHALDQLCGVFRLTSPAALDPLMRNSVRLKNVASIECSRSDRALIAIPVPVHRPHRRAKGDYPPFHLSFECIQTSDERFRWLSDRPRQASCASSDCRTCKPVQFAAYLGAEHAIRVASGTDALILALRALDIGPGDEVVTPANTTVPTAAAIRVVGAAPPFRGRRRRLAPAGGVDTATRAEEPDKRGHSGPYLRGPRSPGRDSPARA